MMHDRTFHSLVTILANQAAERPDQVGYYALDRDLRVWDALTYSQLYSMAKQIAHRLCHDIEPASHVVLLFDCGLEFIKFYFGVLLAGMIPVPLNPNPNRSRDLMLHAIEHGNASAVIFGRHGSRGGVRSCMRALPNTVVLTAADFALTSEWKSEFLPDLGTFAARATTAYVQYSSGTTSKPKAINVSHANVLNNIAMIQHAFELGQTDIGVIWLPNYHDMGLVGGLLTPLVVGFPVYLMRPAMFSADPTRWLRAISTYRATVSGGPDTAYLACARLLDTQDDARLALAQWRVAFTGAEPVKATTLQAFTEKCDVFGFRKTAFLSCYGLAEATLIVTATRSGESPACRRFDREALSRGWAIPAVQSEDRDVELVSSGCELERGSVLIFRADSPEICSTWELGQIGVSGRSLVQGYRDADRSDAWVTREAAQRTYLLTGDVGFRADFGEIYVLGRWQDKIVVNGQNLFFTDMENAIAPFILSVRKHINALVVVAPLDEKGVEIFIELASSVSRYVDAERDSFNHLMLTLRAAIQRSARSLAVIYGIGLYRVRLLKMGGMPRTTSGKIQRNRLNEAGMDRFMLSTFSIDDGHEEIDENEFRLLEEKIVAEILCDVLKTTEEIRPQDNFFMLGGGSIEATQALFRINARFGITLEMKRFLASGSIRELGVIIAIEQQRQLQRASVCK